MSAGQRLLAGAAWVYGAQLLTVLTQLVYAAITSRAVSPEGFGAYAVALSVTGLVALLAMGGLGQTVSRMVDLDRDRLRALVSYAFILGLAAGSALFFSAPFGAWLWGVDTATDPIRWLSVGAVISPFLGLSTGLMARTGRFRQLAILTLSGNVVGMIVGLAFVLTWQTSSSLVVSNVVAQVIIVGGSLLMTDGHLLGVARLEGVSSDLGYSGRLMVANILSYLTGNITKLGLTRGIDSASLGFWNRAEVLTLIPFQQIQTALIRAAYPEFRHDTHDSTRARTVWTDMLIMVAWVSLTLSAGVAVLVPPMVPLVFGRGWDIAATLAAPLAIVGGLQIMSTLLASAIESLGRFRWIWSTDLILITVQVVAAIGIFVYREISIAVIALILTNILRHGWQVLLAGRAGYLNVGRLLVNYSWAILFALVVSGIAWLALQALLLALASPIYWVLVVIVPASALGAVFRFRGRLPVVLIARKYGFVKGL